METLWLMLLKKLKVPSAKSLSSRMETQVIAVSLKDGINQLENSLCRGSLAWFGRQTHNQISMRNLELEGAKRSIPEVAGSNPAPGTIFTLTSAFFC
jgi:hypothetical protein